MLEGKRELANWVPEIWEWCSFTIDNLGLIVKKIPSEMDVAPRYTLLTLLTQLVLLTLFILFKLLYAT